MAEKRIRLQIRGGDKINDNFILLKDELGYKDGILKIGDGNSSWAELRGVSGGNFADGTGEGSVRQILTVDGSRVNIADGDFAVALGQQGAAYGRGAISLGNSSQAGYTFEEWKALDGNQNKTEEDYKKDGNNRYQVAIGQSTKALGKNSFAGGHSSKATGLASFAFGSNTQDENKNPVVTEATNEGAAAFGVGTHSSGHGAISFGYRSISEGDYSFSAGYQSNAKGPHSFSIGYKANATGEGAIAIGNAESTAKGSIAIGKGSKSTAEDSIAIGWQSSYYHNRALGKYCLAMGVGNTAEGTNTYKIGYHNKSNSLGENIISLGFDNSTGGNRHIFQLGDHLISNYRDTVALGCYNLDKWFDDVKEGLLLCVGNGVDNTHRSNALELKHNGDLLITGKMTVSADPTDDNDVTTKKYVDSLSILYKGIGVDSIRTKNAIAVGTQSFAIGGIRYDKTSDNSYSPTIAEGNQSFAGGGSSVAHGDWGFAFGKNVTAWDKASVAFGGGTEAGDHLKINEYGFAFAANESTRAIERGSTAFGMTTIAAGEYSFATGSHTQASGTCSFTQGYKTVASGMFAMAAGDQTWAYYDGSAAFGQYTRTGRKHQFVTGICNVGKEDTLFEIGNGSEDLNRSNAFEVTTTGQVRVYKTPIEDNDVVIKKYLNNYVKNTDYATKDKAGVVKQGGGLYVNPSTGAIQIEPASVVYIDAATRSYQAITTSTYHYAVKRALTHPSTKADYSWKKEDMDAACETLGAVRKGEALYKAIFYVFVSIDEASEHELEFTGFVYTSNPNITAAEALYKYAEVSCPILYTDCGWFPYHGWIHQGYNNDVVFMDYNDDVIITLDLNTLPDNASLRILSIDPV